MLAYASGFDTRLRRLISHYSGQAVWGLLVRDEPLPGMVVAADTRQGVPRVSVSFDTGLEWLMSNDDTAPRLKHLADAAGEWIARDDVQIWYLGRMGNLAPGFGFREGYIGKVPRRMS